MLWLISTVWGATYNVDGGTYTLHLAYKAASNGDTLLISPSYDASVEEPLAVEKDLFIYSAVADATAKVPPMAVVSRTVRFDDLQFVGTMTSVEDSSGSVHACGGACSLLAETSTIPTASDLVFQDGGIVLRDTSMSLDRMEATGLSGNTLVSIDTAGVYTLSLSVKNSTITSSGPIRAVGTNGSGTFEMTVDNSGFVGNSSEGYAADIDVASLTSLSVKNSNFSNGESTESAGSIAADSTSTLITDCDFNDTSGFDGGAISASHTGGGAITVRLTDTDFIGTTASQSGGAIHATGDVELIATRLHVEESNAQQQGGAIYTSDASVELVDAGFYGARASGHGGALYAKGDGAFDLSRGWFCLAKSGTGAGVHLEGGGFSTFTNVVFQGTESTELVLDGGHRAALTHVTFAGEGSEAMTGDTTGLALKNGIVAGYFSGSTLGGTNIVSDYTLWDNDTNSDGGVPVGGTGDVVNVDPGFTEEFEATRCLVPPTLRADSAAVDAGDPATANDLDTTRADMGAFGGASGDPDSVPFSRGADIGFSETGWEESGGDDSAVSTDDSDPDESEAPDDSTPVTDTDTPDRPETTTWLTGGCTASATLVLLLGLGLVRRR